MRTIAGFAVAAVHKGWWWLRQVSGDAAYENYLRWATRATPTRGNSSGRNGSARCPRGGDKSAAAVLSPAQFYGEKLERKYSRLNRCC